MAKEKKSKISYFQSNFTSTVSVALVLLLIGIIAFLGILANMLSVEMRQNVGFNVVLAGDATEGQIENLDNMWKASPYVSKVSFISKEEALESWQEDTGENLVELFGVNPLNAEFQIYVTSDYASVDSLSKIEKELKSIPCIEEVAMHKTETEEANRNINNMVFVLSIVAAVLLLISFVLINNTVRLTVYSRRFIIHTMKLVGAKPGFIRRPFVVSHMLNGLIASIVAMAALTAIYFGLPAFTVVFPVVEVLAVYGSLAVLGTLICGISAFFAANKYIRLNYDDLFKR